MTGTALRPDMLTDAPSSATPNEKFSANMVSWLGRHCAEMAGQPANKKPHQTGGARTSATEIRGAIQRGRNLLASNVSSRHATRQR